MGGVERVDCVVIGAGVVGLAVARSLALQWLFDNSDALGVDPTRFYNTASSDLRGA